MFEGLFTQSIDTAKLYVTDKDFLKRNAKLPGSQPVSVCLKLIKLYIKI